MTPAQRLELRRSEVRQRLGELSALDGDAFGDDARSETDRLSAEYADLERRHRAAVISGDEAGTTTTTTTAETGAGDRERLELRSRASLGRYLLAALRGQSLTGAEAELQAAAGVDGIPLEIWDVPTETRATETRADAPTGAPGTVGVNLDRIRPQVFAHAVLPMLGVEMPRVDTGTYASATITGPLTAGSHAKGADADSTAASFTVSSVTPKRISARMSIRIEDVAAVGQANFEAILRENLSLVLSNELDDQGLNGTGGNSGADLVGLFFRLTNPDDPIVIADFDAFAAAHASGIDGLWAKGLTDVSILCGPATMGLSARTFQTATNYKGEMSAAAYARANTAGFMTNKRMPDAVSTIQQAILYRMGRSFLKNPDGAMRTAVCPTWNEISIDDVYSGSARGERFFTMHTLLGDVIVVQPDAYAQVAYKVA